MKAYTRIPTKRPLIDRLWDAMERSWYPALCFYALLAAALFAINYKG